jgi:divalent metal cation (Fe/Co/Zn/Cd) transporter
LESIAKRQERNRRLLAELKDGGRSARNAVLSIDDIQMSPEEIQIIKALRNAKPDVKEAINVELNQADLKIKETLGVPHLRKSE